MSVSYWRRTSTLGTIESDVLIIGGGIAGLSAALAIQRRGLRVCVIERGEIAAGASGRNAGFLMRGAAENYALAYRAHGRETVRTLWRWTEENLADLKREGVDQTPGYRPTPSCLLAMEESERAELRTSVELLQRDGFAVKWIEAGDDAVWSGATPRPLAGLVNPNDATCNPVEVMHLLAGKITEPIHTAQEVVYLDGDGTMVAARTADGTFLAPHALVCTNAYASLLIPTLRGVVTPWRGQMLAMTPAKSVRLDYAYYVNRGGEYFRQTPDGVIVVGGCRSQQGEAEQTYDDAMTETVQLGIERFARAMLGVDFHIFARWAGTMGFSPDGLPLIGPVDGPWRNGAVWFCGGFTGHGMSLGFRCARAAVEAMLDGKPTPFPLSRLATRS